MPKHARTARKHRQALLSLLAPKFGSEVQKSNRMTPMPDDLTDTEADYISEEGLELLNDLSEDYPEGRAVAIYNQPV